MTDRTVFDKVVDIMPAAPFLPEEAERGWWVGSIQEPHHPPVYSIQFVDGRTPPITNPARVVTFIRDYARRNPTIINNRRNVMPDQTGNFIDEAAIEVTPDLEKYVNPTWEYRPADQVPELDAETGLPLDPSTREQLLAAKQENWHRLFRNTLSQVRADQLKGRRGSVGGRVCKALALDISPERIGKPASRRPGVPMIVWFVMPTDHPLYKKGREYAVAYYDPTATATIDEIVGGKMSFTEISSLDEPEGFVGIIGWRTSIDECKQERETLRRNLVTFSLSAVDREDIEDLNAGLPDVDVLPENLHSRDSW